QRSPNCSVMKANVGPHHSGFGSRDDGLEIFRNCSVWVTVGDIEIGITNLFALCKRHTATVFPARPPWDDCCPNCSVFCGLDRETRRADARPGRGGAAAWKGGCLAYIGVRSICAGIAALAIGVAAESVARHVVGAVSAGPRPESATISVFEMIRPKSLDH